LPSRHVFSSVKHYPEIEIVGRRGAKRQQFFAQTQTRWACAPSGYVSGASTITAEAIFSSGVKRSDKKH